MLKSGYLIFMRYSLVTSCQGVKCKCEKGPQSKSRFVTVSGENVFYGIGRRIEVALAMSLINLTCKNAALSLSGHRSWACLSMFYKIDQTRYKPNS